jgi:hypothetical protein
MTKSAFDKIKAGLDDAAAYLKEAAALPRRTQPNTKKLTPPAPQG